MACDGAQADGVLKERAFVLTLASPTGSCSPGFAAACGPPGPGLLPDFGRMGPESDVCGTGFLLGVLGGGLSEIHVINLIRNTLSEFMKICSEDFCDCCVSLLQML